MGDGRDFRTDDVELVDAEQPRFGIGYVAPSPFDDIPNKQHIGTVDVAFEPVRHILAQHRRRERTEAFTLFYLAVQQLLHRRDRKSEVEEKSVSVRVDLGGRRYINKKKYKSIKI